MSRASPSATDSKSKPRIDYVGLPKRVSSRRQTAATVQLPAQLDPKQRYSLAETNAILRQSPAKTFSDIKLGKLKVFKDGARTYVSGTELIRRSAPPDSSSSCE